jgi:hypothetical protein
MTKSRHVNRPRFRMTPAALEIIRRDYPNAATADIAKQLGCHIGVIYRTAWAYGLKKSIEFCASPQSGRVYKGNHDGRGAEYRYPKGNVPANKGLRRPGYAPGRMASTQFKKGQRPEEARNYIPIGGFRINADGMLDRKMCDDCIPQNRFMGYHRYVWIMANGPIPPGHVVRFKPNRKTTWAFAITPDALECITLRENRLRNSIHQVMSPELREISYLRGQIKRTINRRLKDGKEHDRGAPRAPVRHTRRAARQKGANGYRAGARSG